MYNPFGEINRAPVMVNGAILPKKVALVNYVNEPISIVSKNYKVVTNQTIVDLFGSAFSNLQIEKTTDHVDQYMSRWKRRIILKKEAFNFDIMPGDSVGIMLELFNSYTGKSSWGFRVMGYRWICTNGLVMGSRRLFSASFSHMTNIIDRMRSAFDSQLANIPMMISTWKDWQDVKFTERHWELFFEQNEVKEKLAEEIIGTWRSRSLIEKLPENKWSAYNALTYLATHNLKTRKVNSSPLFSSSAKKYANLANELYDYNPPKELVA